MTPKKPRKPTAAELVRQLAAQVAELRGRVEVLEKRPTTEIVRHPASTPEWWEFWR